MKDKYVVHPEEFCDPDLQDSFSFINIQLNIQMETFSAHSHFLPITSNLSQTLATRQLAVKDDVQQHLIFCFLHEITLSNLPAVLQQLKNLMFPSTREFWSGMYTTTQRCIKTSVK